MTDIDTAWDYIWDLWDTLWDVLINDFFINGVLEGGWNVFVFVFFTLSNVWGFTFLLGIFCYVWYRKFIE